MAVSVRRLLFNLVFVVASVLLSTDVFGQVQIQRLAPARVVPAQSSTVQAGTVDSGTPGSADVPATSETPSADAAASPEKKKLELLLAARFDRSTEAVLKAWSQRDRENRKQAEARTPPDTWTGKTVNVYQDLVVFELETAPADLKTEKLLILQVDGQELGRAKVISVKAKRVAANLLPLDSNAEGIDGNAPEANAGKKEAASKPGEQTPASGSGAEPAAENQSGTDTDDPVADKGADSKQGTSSDFPALETGVEVQLQLAMDAAASDAESEKSVQEEVDAFVRNVTLGEWQKVKEFLAAMKSEDADKVYAHLLSSLANPGSATPEGVPPEIAAQLAAQAQQQGQTPPAVHLNPNDILQLSEASPVSIRISLRSSGAGKGGDGISGKWKGRLLMDGIPEEARSFDMELNWDGQNVTGSITANGQTMKIDGGSFDSVTGKVSVPLINEVSIGVLAGSIREGKLTGSVTADGVSMGVEAELVEAIGGVVGGEEEGSVEDAHVQLPISDVSSPAAEAKVNQPADTADSDKDAKHNSAHINAIARLMRNAHQAGHDFSAFAKRVEKGTTHFGSDDPIKRLTAADLFLKAGLIEFAEQFLPSLNDELSAMELPALKLWSQLALAKFSQKRVAQWLERAWTINQTIVTMESINDADRDAALTQLIELSSQVEKEIGAEWLNASFSDEPERGMRILTNLGTKASSMASRSGQVSEQQRLKLLRLQNQAVESLLEINPDTASQWQQALTLLAQNWLVEAETSIEHSSQNSRREFMQIDMYGNYYWINEDDYMRRYTNQRRPRPIKLGDMLEVAPSEPWQKIVSPSLRTQFRKVLANLHLRVNEEDQAFPYIEQMAPDHPEIARDLIHEFLRIWTQNHDPNTDRRQRNPYIYMYGFDQKAEAIPLTRSKQERNLVELAGWVKRIRQMPIDNIDESLLANAFTTCHSSAEVFDLDRVRSVFGNLDQLKPETVAALCQKMRVNLSTNWRDIRAQEAKQTRRREPEVQKEVLRGYAVALELADEAIQAEPENWQLQLARACLMFDQNAYSQSVQKSSEFSDRRDAAFEQFQLAADKYNQAVPTLEEKDQSTDVFDYWFYASLGACDLGKITDKTVPDLRQYKKIRSALEQMPASIAEMHMSKFANNLFTRMSPIKPEIKFRYLRGGFEIVGDHPRAWEARNLYDYYRDLVSEIKLAVDLDGNDNVGHEDPFGIYVNLLHTTEIERESGGFGKYVQNQNSLIGAYNYGRPTTDYRDKFTDAVNQALGEHFEVLNVTFQSPDTMKSRPAAETGWRVTPYAYVLLKPLGPQVDRIAPLKLDLDFLDTSGYVVIPIESPAVVVDATAPKGTQRPVKDLQIAQTLDERQADDGKLILEISATAKGLVPDLDEIVDLNLDDFEIVNVDDQGVLPQSFDKESDEIQILSDRSWTVEYKARDESSAPGQFSFASARMDSANMRFQRYEDADLVEVERTIPLEKQYGSFSWSFLYWLIPLIVLLLVAAVAAVRFMRQGETGEQQRFQVPEEINPFTVLTLLKDIKRRNGFDSRQVDELQHSIDRVESHYFSNAKRNGDSENGDSEDLENLARTWVGRAN